MKIGFVVNVMDSADAGQTTYRLAAACAALGHEAWVMSTGNFCYEADGAIRALARTVPVRKYPSPAAFHATLNGPKAETRWIAVDNLDVLLLRSNPSVQKPWAQYAGIHFGRLAMPLLASQPHPLWIPVPCNASLHYTLSQACPRPAMP